MSVGTNRSNIRRGDPENYGTSDEDPARSVGYGPDSYEETQRSVSPGGVQRLQGTAIRKEAQKRWDDMCMAVSRLHGTCAEAGGNYVLSAHFEESTGSSAATQN